MFKRIATSALIAGLVLATATALPVSDAMAHGAGQHGGGGHGGGHASSGGGSSRNDHGSGDRGGRSADFGRGDRSSGGHDRNGVPDAVGTALGVAHALGIPGF